MGDVMRSWSEEVWAGGGWGRWRLGSVEVGVGSFFWRGAWFLSYLCYFK